MTPLTGIYGGLVEENKDQTGMGRLKVRVPAVYGLADEVPTDRLPWALPRGMPFGNTSDSGGMSWIPSIGDTVVTSFLDGEPEKPMWEWFTAPVDKPLKLHQYGTDGSPNRSILTRYGHSVEFSANRVVVTTKQGQQLVIDTSDDASGGQTAIQTPKGQSITLNDTRQNVVIQGLNAAAISASKVVINAPTSTLIKTGRFSMVIGNMLLTFQGNTIILSTSTGASVIISEDGHVAMTSSQGFSVGVDNDRVTLNSAKGTAGVVLEEGKISIRSPQLVIDSGSVSIGIAGQNYPVVVASPEFIAWVLGHTHGNGNDGSPTAPPIPLGPPFPTQQISTTLQAG